MPGFDRWGQIRRQVSMAETPVKQLQYQAVALQGESRIVTRPLIAHERVGSIHFVPLVPDIQFFQPSANLSPSVERDMRVLAAPDVQQLAFNFTGTQ